MTDKSINASNGQETQLLATFERAVSDMFTDIFLTLLGDPDYLANKCLSSGINSQGSLKTKD